MTAESNETLKQIEALENEIYEKRQLISELWKKAPRETVANHILKNSDNQNVKLSELFGDKQDLLIIHNMGKQCPYCTLWADGINGLLDHIENRAAIALVSSDSPAEQKEFAHSRSWKFRMLSSEDSDFTRAMGYTYTQEGKNYLLPGVSAFRFNEDGTIVRTGRAVFGPGDSYCSVWHFFDLLADGPNNWQPRYSYL